MCISPPEKNKPGGVATLECSGENDSREQSAVVRLVKKTADCQQIRSADDGLGEEAGVALALALKPRNVELGRAACVRRLIAPPGP